MAPTPCHSAEEGARLPSDDPTGPRRRHPAPPARSPARRGLGVSLRAEAGSAFLLEPVRPGRPGGSAGRRLRVTVHIFITRETKRSNVSTREQILEPLSSNKNGKGFLPVKRVRDTGAYYKKSFPGVLLLGLKRAPPRRPGRAPWFTETPAGFARRRQQGKVRKSPSWSAAGFSTADGHLTVHCKGGGWTGSSSACMSY